MLKGGLSYESTLYYKSRRKPLKKKKSFQIQHEFCIHGHDVLLQNSLQW